MPQALVAIIPALIGAGATSYAAYSANQNSNDALNASKQQALTMQRQQQQDDTNARRQAIMKAAPGLQEATGGSLTPDSFSSIIASLTGSPGSIGLAQSTLFPQNGLQKNSSEPGLSDAMDQLFQGGGSSGGGGGISSSSLTMPY